MSSWLLLLLLLWMGRRLPLLGRWSRWVAATMAQRQMLGHSGIWRVTVDHWNPQTKCKRTARKWPNGWAAGNHLEARNGRCVNGASEGPQRHHSNPQEKTERSAIRSPLARPLRSINCIQIIATMHPCGHSGTRLVNMSWCLRFLYYSIPIMLIPISRKP